MKTTKSSRLIIALFILLIVWLGFSCLNYYQASKFVTPVSLESNNGISKLNVLVNSKARQLQALQTQAAGQDKILGYMVWPQERRNILEQAIQVSQQQINLDSNESEYWYRLLRLQYEFDPQPLQISWILEKLNLLEGWNNKSTIILTRYCVPYVFYSADTSPAVCENIINHLPILDKSRLARQIGISVADLDLVIMHYQKGS